MRNMNEIIYLLAFFLIGIPLLCTGLVLYTKYILDPFLKWLFDKV